MKRRRFSEKRGFTLAELLIAVVVIGILVAILIPVFNRKIEKSRETYDIATMRQAASAAMELYQLGIHDKKSAEAAKISWDDSGGDEGKNAYGAYDPRTGKLVPKRENLGANYVYGKGTKTDGGTRTVIGNPEGAYVSTEDYRDAVIVVSIFPKASPARIDVYWKYNKGSKKGKYVGGDNGPNIPKYSMRIYMN